VGTLLTLATVFVLGSLVGRWWLVAALPLLFTASITLIAVNDNFNDPCTRSDGCGLGPVAQATALALAFGIVIAAVTAGGVLARRGWDRRRRGRRSE